MIRCEGNRDEGLEDYIIQTLSRSCTRKTCPRVHYDCTDQIPGMKLLVSKYDIIRSSP